MLSPCLWLPDQSQPWLSTVKKTGPSFPRGQKRKYFFTLKKALGESRNQKLINVKYPVNTCIYITQLLQKIVFCILEEIKLTSCNQTLISYLASVTQWTLLLWVLAQVIWKASVSWSDPLVCKRTRKIWQGNPVLSHRLLYLGSHCHQHFTMNSKNITGEVTSKAYLSRIKAFMSS